ncbi:hypothetical protein TNCV_4884081 [Trichonephila clavipes]|nr:hypothetical protein TNCV_4884081 [Trichonephila clavipes]
MAPSTPPHHATGYTACEERFQRCLVYSRWFEVHDREFTLLNWTAQSSDFNQIENIWEKIERYIMNLDPVPSNLRTLDSIIHRIWSQIPHITYQHFKVSMLKKVCAKLRAKGGPILH